MIREEVTHPLKQVCIFTLGLEPRLVGPHWGLSHLDPVVLPFRVPRLARRHQGDPVPRSGGPIPFVVR
jgi:hypothetical protein